MRHLALPLLLLLGTLAVPSRGLAEPLTLKAAPTVLSLSSHGEAAQLALADRWVDSMREMRARRQRLDTWIIPTLLGSAAVVGAATALLPGLSPEARYVTGASGLLAAAAMVPAILERPPQKARWFAIGGGLFAAAFGAAGFVESFHQKNRDCTGYCFNEKSIGWLGGAFFAQGLALIPLAFTDRGPSLQELNDYRSLPANERPVAARKLLARVDRAERKAMLLMMINGMIGVGVFGAGAVFADNRAQRSTLLGFAGFTLGTNTLTLIATLLQKSRLERMSFSEPPEEVERVLW